MTSVASSRAALYGLGFAGLWAALAVLRPTVTFHLAPLIVTASVPWVFVGERRQEAAVRDRLAAVLVGLAIASVTTTVLGLLGRLAGPSLFPMGGAVTESFILVAVGGLIGVGSLAWQPASPPRT